MTKQNALKIFGDKKVRTVWDDGQEKWYFSVVDVVAVLTDSPNPRKYWSVLKNRLKKEGSQLTTNCSQLKMPSSDGKVYLTDVADSEQLFRLIQSIPSPKAEPFKLWLAEASTKDISVATDPQTFGESAVAARKGGDVARVARQQLEASTGQKVVTPLNAKSIRQIAATKKKRKELGDE